MKFVPRYSQIVGRIVIQRSASLIVRPDETKNITKMILVDAVGPDAAAAGVSVGDLILPNALGNIVLDGGAIFRPILDEKNAIAFVTGVDTSELLIQTNNAGAFVPFDADGAAQSICPPCPKEAAAKAA